MNKNDFIKSLYQHINFRLTQSKTKITDLVLEELISFALDDSNNEHVYESGSHGAGTDIKSILGDFSVKSGQYKKDGTINISSFRLSRFFLKGKNDFDGMIHYIDNDGKNFDFYAVLCRHEDDKIIKYFFYILPSDIFKATEMDWKETKSGWITSNENVELKIQKSMSYQLWINLKEDFIKEYLEFTIETDKSQLACSRFQSKLD